MRLFENWKAGELERSFGLMEVDKHPLLEDWIVSTLEPTTEELHTLTRLQARLAKQVDSWNEDEVKFFFIGPLVELANIEGPGFKPYTQRFLKAKPVDVNGKIVEIGGKPDMLVASGKEDPERPFFFLHEYKPEKRRDSDPKGQLLAAMFAAQTENEASYPVYGCYVVGRLWFFVILADQNWARSQAFDASQSGLFNIFAMLRAARTKIAQLLANP